LNLRSRGPMIGMDSDHCQVVAESLQGQRKVDAEMGGGSREIDAGRFKDNPRRLGKGRVRLVGLAPL
jgi:hypothetical protein